MLDLLGTIQNTNKENSNTYQPSDESQRLLPSNASGDSAVGGSSQQHQYYFLGKAGSDYQGGTSASVRDADGGEVVEEIPEGSHTDEFAPKQLVPLGARSPASRRPTTNGTNTRGGFWSKLFGSEGGVRKQQHPSHHIGGEVGTLLKPRKAPIKVEPKVFFANERTFLAWMNLSITLAGASIAILAFAQDQNPFAQLYGILLLPVAIAFIIYSMYQYNRRSTMIRRRNPGPYEDTVGPAVLGLMLMFSIVAQFALKLYSIANHS